jgi:hypothetical protein
MKIKAKRTCCCLVQSLNLFIDSTAGSQALVLVLLALLSPLQAALIKETNSKLNSGSLYTNIGHLCIPYWNGRNILT